MACNQIVMLGSFVNTEQVNVVLMNSYIGRQYGLPFPREAPDEGKARPVCWHKSQDALEVCGDGS